MNKFKKINEKIKKNKKLRNFPIWDCQGEKRNYSEPIIIRNLYWVFRETYDNKCHLYAN